MAREPDATMLSDDERRAIGRWAAECADRVLPLFETRAPGDRRPREAVEEIRAFAGGGARTARLRAVAWAALAAAREVHDPAATAAARSAGLSAATAYTHALATPGQAMHILGPAVYAARAAGLAAGDEAGAGDEAIRRAASAAPEAVREVLRRMPARGAGQSRLGALYHRLDAALRGSG